MKKIMKKTALCIISLAMLIMGCANTETAVTAPPSGSSQTVADIPRYPEPAVAAPSGSSPGMDMDAAIREAAAQMEAKIPAKTMVALVSVASPSAAFSSQVLARIESAIVSSGKLGVVDRANLDKVRNEQGFQLSGEVDDESAKAIGKLLGAGAIVTGTLTDLGDVYSLTLKAINMETAMVVVSYLADLAKSARVETLLASGGGGTSGTRTAQTGGSASAAARPVAPVLKNGTYTFRPRPQAYQGGKAISVYLVKVVVRSGYLTVYLVDNPTGNGNYGTPARIYDSGKWGRPNSSKVSIQDLDNPSRTWIAVEQSTDGAINAAVLTFQGVTATRFTIVNKNAEVPIDFDEITLGEPD
ncbi:hypothetical protein FACS1894200_07050 [Spirochaetia bacterium]|nr:hypothetical protein FACS1894200_07050 [Spirochaetia bacterium]